MAVVGLWILPMVLLSAAPNAPIPAGCEKKCEKKYVPCRDGRAEQQMMCFEVVKRCELRCDKPAQKKSSRAQGRRRR